MNIPAVNNLKFFQNTQNTISKPKTQNNADNCLYISQQPKKEIVFGARLFVTIADFYGKSIDKSNPTLQSAAYRFLDTVGAVVSTLAQKGTKISAMPREIAEKHVLKSGNSAKSKVLRSGNLDLTDRIRTTVYVQDLYDLSTLCNFIKEMSLRGYKLAKTEEPAKKMLAKGYKLTQSEVEKGNVKVNDISIRLYDKNDTPLKNIHPDLSFALDGMQKSGYEDIQLRFTNGKDKFETIMLFGPHYAEAKHTESEKVRKYTREFDTLAIKKDTTKETLAADKKTSIENMLGEIKFYINSIQGGFYDHVTRPLYHWAKGLDYYGMNELEKKSPEYTEISYTNLNRNFYNLKAKVKQCYDYVLEMTKKEEDKAILIQKKNNDIKIINKIHKGLTNTGTEFGILKIPTHNITQK